MREAGANWCVGSLLGATVVLAASLTWAQEAQVNEVARFRIVGNPTEFHNFFTNMQATPGLGASKAPTFVIIPEIYVDDLKKTCPTCVEYDPPSEPGPIGCPGQGGATTFRRFMVYDSILNSSKIISGLNKLSKSDDIAIEWYDAPGSDLLKKACPDCIDDPGEPTPIPWACP